MKNMLCEAKNMLMGSKELVLHRSFDIKMAIAKKDELDSPCKSICLHKSCSTPLWKIALWVLGIALALILIRKMRKRRTKAKG